MTRNARDCRYYGYKCEYGSCRRNAVIELEDLDSGQRPVPRMLCSECFIVLVRVGKLTLLLPGESWAQNVGEVVAAEPAVSGVTDDPETTTFEVGWGDDG